MTVGWRSLFTDLSGASIGKIATISHQKNKKRALSFLNLKKSADAKKSFLHKKGWRKTAQLMG